MWPSFEPSINCALIRTRPPALRTLPSSTWVTFSWLATCRTSTDLALKVNAVLRDTTCKADTLLKSVMMSSLIPSLKYSCSGSPLMLANGRTQIENERADDGAGPPAADEEAGAVRSAMLATTFRQPGASASPFHRVRSANWI